MTMRTFSIVAGGQRRAYAAAIGEVRAEVAAKYTEEIKAAGFWGIVRLRRKIEKEIRERMDRIAPRHGLY